MNFLFHMLLSANDDQLLVGNVMGDFVKGPLVVGTYPPRILQGLQLHRSIDSFAQRDASFQSSRLRLSPHIGLYRGILVDLFYDHFLARDWDLWSDVSFPDYIAAARSTIERYMEILPPRFQEFVPVIFNELLPSYVAVSGIESALQRMSRRVVRSNPLADGGSQLTLYYVELHADFVSFMSAVQQFTKEIIPQEAKI
jgi:acyl carrier protein phosphodiesterase